MSRVLLLQGNQAVVEGAIAAGVKFYGGYPITPSTEIAEQLAARLPQVGGKFMQTEDEIAGLGAAIGASMGGKKAMTATSGPGFSLKQEMLGLACTAEIPVVLVDVQRVGPATGQPTSPAPGYRPAHQPRPGRSDDDPLGYPRRPLGHRGIALQRAGMLLAHHPRG